MSLESLLSNDTVKVQSRPPAKDASGGIKPGGYTDLYANVPARVEDLSAGESLDYAMRGMTVSTVVYTQQGGVKEGMLVLTTDGRTLIVEGVQMNKAIGGMPTYFEVQCSEYRPGA